MEQLSTKTQGTGDTGISAQDWGCPGSGAASSLRPTWRVCSGLSSVLQDAPAARDVPARAHGVPLFSGVTCKTNLAHGRSWQFGWLIRTIFIRLRDIDFQSLKYCLENSESHLEPFRVFYRETDAQANGYLKQL